MIHELILVLLNKRSTTIHGKELLERLHPSEKCILEKILRIAERYWTLAAFVKKYTFPTSLLKKDGTKYNESTFGSSSGEQQKFDDTISTSHHGMYIQAFCLGLEKALNSYRDDAVLLETSAINDPGSVNLFKVLSVTAKYDVLFQVLCKIIDQVEKQGIRGGGLLNYLHNQMLLIYGSPQIYNVVQLIFRECLLIFMDQLSEWLLLGHLNDTYKEFFISCNGSDNKSSMMDNTVVEPQFQKSIGQLGNSRSDANVRCKNYNINIEMLPSFIPDYSREKILYIGKMIMLFRNDPKDVIKMGSATRTRQLSVWGDKEAEYFKKLRDICKNERFDKILFEKTLSEIHSDVVKCVWKSFVVDTKLIEEIGLMKEFFLMGRGELFLEFLYKTDCIRKRPFLPSKMNRNCNEAFVMAAHNVLYSNEVALKKFSIQFSLDEYIGSDEDLLSEQDGWWRTVNLKYNITWPMHLIFKPAVLRDYNRLFNFLMRVAKAQRDLKEVWFFDLKQNRNDDIFSDITSTNVWRLQNNLMFMINNLQHYLQVYVLDSEYTKLQEKLKVIKDFEEILSAHTTFLVNIMSQSFLWMAENGADNCGGEILPVMNTIDSLLLLVDRFCKTVNVLITDQNALNSIQQELDATIIIFLEYMGTMQAHPSGVHLSQLNLQLNFNGWFTKTLNACNMA